MKPNPGLAFATFLCAAITLGFTITAIWCLFQPGLWIASLIFVPFIAVMAWLTRVVWRQARGIEPPGLLQPDPRNLEVLVWCSSRARAWGSFIAAGVFALLAIGMLVGAIGAMFARTFSAGGEIAVTLMLALLALVFGGLTSLVWRNGLGFHGARIELAPDELRLHLPRWRSLIHRPPAIHASYRYDELAGIETRLEAYPSQMMAMLQRPYWLVLQNGERVFLFEDRGIDSPQATHSLDSVATAICEKAGGEWREMPMAEGRGGILGAWHTVAPAEGAPPLTTSRADTLKRRALMTGRVAGYAFAIVILARALAWALGADG